MPGPSEQSSSGAILDFFDGRRYQPFTTSEIASETGLSKQTVREELHGLVDRGLLQTKELADGKRVWWPPLREHGREHAESTIGSIDAVDEPEIKAVRERLIGQHRQLADFVTRINITDDLDEILRQITEEARELVGAHQSVTSRTINQNWEQAINGFRCPTSTRNIGTTTTNRTGPVFTHSCANETSRCA